MIFKAMLYISIIFIHTVDASKPSFIERMGTRVTDTFDTAKKTIRTKLHAHKLASEAEEKCHEDSLYEMGKNLIDLIRIAHEKGLPPEMIAKITKLREAFDKFTSCNQSIRTAKLIGRMGIEATKFTGRTIAKTPGAIKGAYQATTAKASQAAQATKSWFQRMGTAVKDSAYGTLKNIRDASQGVSRNTPSNVNESTLD
jgi:hypothetical protein